MFSMEKFDHYFKWTNYYGYWYKNLYIKTFAYAKTFFTSIPVLFEFNNPLKRFSPKNQMFLCVCVCVCVKMYVLLVWERVSGAHLSGGLGGSVQPVPWAQVQAVQLKQ